MVKSSHLEIHRSILSGTYRAGYEIKGELEAYELPILLNALMRRVLPEVLFTDKEILNIKGRDAAALEESELTRELCPKPPRNTEEFFCASGNVVIGEGSIIHREPFSIQLLSRFVNFEKTHRIIHAIETLRNGALPTFVRPEEIGEVFPLEVNSFRIGIDVFTSRFISLFGFTPTVTQGLIIEASTNKFQIKISAEALKAKHLLPLEKEGLFDRLNCVIDEIFSFSILKDYTKKLEMA